MPRTIPEEKRNWFRFVFQLRASVLPAILPRILVCCGFALGVTMVHRQGWPVSLPVESSIVPSLVLGLLLVFRTNTAYERFWEGRKQWGTLVNTVRNLARQIWVAIAAENAQDRAQKIAMMRLLVAFAVTTKRHLRSETMACDELAPLMPQQRCDRLTTMHNPPLEVAFWIGDYLQLQYDRDRITAYQLAAMFKLLDTMVDVLGACERILKTPIPLAYSIHLKQLLLIYCLGLSFQMVDEFRWWTAVVVGLVSFTVFGIEEIGIEIENPFGYDRNDLPLDQICQTMAANIEDLITLSPSVQQWHKPPSTLDE
ncbi:bestrophin family protein [Spirulina major]|uniref:bestrophin family protein n=1 Tax=Spirulina major TaxID=270636 RepID=UPI000B2B99F6|nr:bestrophin family ion channel [Spirulina major]